MSDSPSVAVVVGYWNAAFAGIVIIEHVLFRGGSFSEAAYPVATLLPRSVLAVLAFICACGALVPFVSQASVAKSGSGDCGIYVALVVSMLCYGFLRALKRWDTRRKKGVKEQGVQDGLKV